MVNDVDDVIQRARLKVKQFKQREKDILEHALQLMLDQGEDKVTVEKIAQSVDIGKGTVYKHFASKSEIYVSLLLAYEQDLNDRFSEIMETVEPKDQQEAAARAYFAHRFENPAKAKLFQRLEERLRDNNEQLERLNSLHELRNKALETLNKSMSARIEMGGFKDVPPIFYNLTYWALTQGAVELLHSQFYQDAEIDSDELMKFIMEVGLRIGKSDAQ